MFCIDLGLKGVHQHLTYDNLSNILEANLKMYYDWAFLGIGGWTDVNIPTSGIYSTDFSRLRPVSDPNYTNGQVWETPRKDLVWETGITYTDPTGGTHTPIPVGTPTVNGVAATGYYVDYINGRLVFNSPVSTSSVVKMPYAYRSVQIYKSDQAQWWREIQQNAYRTDNTQYLQSSSGIWSLFSQNRVQLPAVIIEVVPRGNAVGLELGGTLKQRRDVEFTILSETPWERKNLMDIFNAQVDKSYYLFDINTALREWPLDYRGSLTGTREYPYFISEEGHRWRKMHAEDSFIINVGEIHNRLYISTVRTTTETIG